MPGTNPLLGGGGFHHVAVKVHDFDKSIGFYTQILGFKEKIRWGERKEGQDGRAIMLDTGDGNYLELFAGGPATPRTPSSPTAADGPILHIAFRTADVDAVVVRARTAGITITMEPKHVDIPSTPGPTPVRIAFVQGYDGEILELFQNELT